MTDEVRVITEDSTEEATVDASTSIVTIVTPDPEVQVLTVLSAGPQGPAGEAGVAGEDGTSGTSGDGTSGTSGTSGDGTSGTSGTSTVGFTSGTSGTSGEKGETGDAGQGGTSGSSGTSGDGTGGTSGTSGTSGKDGTSGVQGPAGADGASGTSGTSGIDGDAGTSGTSGTSGSNGTSGTSGIAGPAGTSGTSGTSSTAGTSGTSGIGTSGTSGTSGEGTSGTSGTSGTGVTSGTSGPAGTSGTSGTSAVGTSGTSGTSGSGTSGTSGITGPAGTSGTSGVTGTSGTSGTSGTKGTSGTSGTSGSGTSGTSGVTGPAGTSGTSGTSSTGGGGSSGTSGTSGTGGAGGGTVVDLDPFLVSYRSTWWIDTMGKMLLHFNGTSGSTSITDEYENTITPHGGVTLTNTYSKFGSGSLNLDGTDDYIDGAVSFAFGSGIWSISLWARPTTTGDANGSYLFHKANNASGVSPISLIQTAGSYQVKLYVSETTQGDIVNGAVIGTMTQNAWNHIGICRGGVSIYGGMNGTINSTSGCALDVSLYDASTPVLIGGGASADTYFTGQIDEAFVRFDSSDFMTDYTVPTEPIPSKGYYARNDIVIDENGEIGAFWCFERHTPSEENKPGSGTSWTDYWEQISTLGTSGGGGTGGSGTSGTSGTSSLFDYRGGWNVPADWAEITPSAGLEKLDDTTPLSSVLTTQSKVIDGDLSTNINDYCGTPDSYGVDLGSATEYLEVRLVCHLSAYSATPPQYYYSTDTDSFSVYGSNDNSAWTLLGTFDAPTIEGSAANTLFHVTLDLTDGPYTYRYYKVKSDTAGIGTMPGSENSYWKEVKIYQKSVASEEYSVGDVITHENNVYTCIADNTGGTGNEPGTTSGTSYWDLMLLGGTSGTSGIGITYQGAWDSDSGYAALMHFEGTSGSTTFTDACGHTVTVVSGPVLSNSQYKFGTSSCYFAGAGYVSIVESGTDLSPGTDDFTIDLWAYPVNVAQANATVLACKNLSDNSDWSWFIAQSAGTYDVVFYAASTTNWDLVNGDAIGTLTANAWNHVAVCRQGSSIYYFMNGVKSATVSSVSNNTLKTTTSNINIGGGYYENTYFRGYIDEFRFIIGEALFTDTFTPPTSPSTPDVTYSINDLVLNDSVAYLCTAGHVATADKEPGGGTSWDDYWVISTGTSGTSGTSGVGGVAIRGVWTDPAAGSVVLMHMEGTNGSTTFTETNGGTVTNDNGAVTVNTTTYKFGTGSAYYSGSNTRLKVAYISNQSFDAENFTIEGWFYPTAVGQGYNSVMLAQAGDNANWEYLLCQDSGGYGVHFYAAATASPWDLVNGASVGTMTANAWNHVAVVRSGSFIYYFMNGVKSGTESSVGTTAIYNQSSNANFSIGGCGLGGAEFTGYIDEVRTQRGIAQYTSTFTPPTEAFGAAVNYNLNDIVTNDGSSYICMQAHSSTGDKEPGSGTSWGSYWTNLGDYGSKGSYTGTLTGFASPPTGTVYYTKINNVVTIDLPLLQGTSNTKAMTLTGGVTAIRPTNPKRFISRIRNNGTWAVAIAEMGTSGTITFYATIAEGAFTTSGTKGIGKLSFSYTLV